MKKLFSFVLALCAVSTMAFAETSLNVDCGASAQIIATPKTGYHFVKWSDGVNESTQNPLTVSPTANVTYTAYFAIDTFTVTFKNYDGTVLQSTRPLYGETITAPAAPSKPSTAQYSYEFASWSPNVAYTVTADAVYTAQFTENLRSYTITFKNDDGSVLQSTEVEYGTTPAAPTATKTATAEFTYEFAGWGEDLAPVTGEKIYTATYTATKNKYTVTFKNYDGTVLQTSQVEYGVVPSYTGAAPTKPADAENTYTWTNAWDAALVAVTGDVVYTATFTNSTQSYTVTLSGENGTYTGAGTYAYGANVTITATAADDCYEFVKWSDGDTNATRTVTISGNLTLTATFRLKQYTVTVESDNETQGTVSVILVP